MPHPRQTLRLVLCGAALLAVIAPARAQDDTRQDIAMQNQILELRHDLDSLRDQVAAGAGAGSAPLQPPPSDASPPANATDVMPALLNRVSALEDQVRTLQGSLDEIRNTLQTQNADLTKQIGDLSFRVQALEGGAPPAPSASLPPGTAPLAASSRLPPPPPPVGHATLQQGYAALARRDYPAAEAAARDVLATPRSPHAADAQFLLAQSLAGEHEYQPAALAYDDAYTRQRTGSHATDALIGLASSLAALGEKPAACATLDKLHAEFPSARPDIRASAAAVSRRAGCR
jgi:TolA-binding protein